MGGIGVLSVVQVALSAFLASAAGSSSLITRILPESLKGVSYSAKLHGLSVWFDGHSFQPPPPPPPPPPADIKQKSWDYPHTQEVYDHLLEIATDTKTRIRLLAAATKEVRCMLNAFPVSSLGLRMDNESVRIAVGLRLSVPLCQPHRCCHCGAEVDEFARHGLSCVKSEGHHFRHAAINSIVQRALSSAQIPSRLEPSGLSRLAVSEAGAVAVAAEKRKCDLYQCLTTSHHFIPIVVETSGVIGPVAIDFINDLGNRIHVHTLEPKSRTYLLQRISVAVQWGNAVSIMGSAPTNQFELI